LLLPPRAEGCCNLLWLLQKAQRGALVRRVPIGYVKGLDDRIEKDPDARVGSTVDLIFRKFAELGSVRQVYFWLDQQQIWLMPGRVRRKPSSAPCGSASSYKVGERLGSVPL
jgi:hypothetical protein